MPRACVVLVPSNILMAGHACSLATNTNQQSQSQLHALLLVPSNILTIKHVCLCLSAESISFQQCFSLKKSVNSTWLIS